MADERAAQTEGTSTSRTTPQAEPNTPLEAQIEEFSIVELEDRLEFLECCDPNCGCPA